MRPRPSTPLLVLAALLALVFAPTPQAHAQQRATVEKAAVNVSGLKPGTKTMAAVVLDIKPGFHAQSRTPSQEFYIKFDAKADDNPALKFGEVIYPEGHVEEYPALGKMNVYVGRTVVYFPIEVKPDAPPGETKITGRLRYQICDDQLCFPPESSKFEIVTKVVGKDEAVTPEEEELFKDVKAPDRARYGAVDRARHYRVAPARGDLVGRRGRQRLDLRPRDGGGVPRGAAVQRDALRAARAAAEGVWVLRGGRPQPRP
jgi:hypothetical protein